VRGMGQKMDRGAQKNLEHGDSVKSSRAERSSGDPAQSNEHSQAPILPNRDGLNEEPADNSSLVFSPLEEVKRYANEFRSARAAFHAIFHRAEDYFDSVLVTAGTDRTNPDYPSFIYLNSIPDLRGHNPHKAIFGQRSVSPNPYFLAAITVPLPSTSLDQSEGNQASVLGVQPGFTKPGEKPCIPRDRMLIAWLEYSRSNQCYYLHRPNSHSLVDSAQFRFENLTLLQQCTRDQWNWSGLERAVREVLAPKGLEVVHKDLGAFNHIWDDQIEIRRGSSKDLPPAYEMLADVLDAIAEVNVRKEGFFNTRVIAKPERPLAINITEQAKRFADINRVSDRSKKLDTIIEQGRYLLGQYTEPYTVGCLGELVSRLEREANAKAKRSSLPFELPESPLFRGRQNSSSQLVSDLEDILRSWVPNPSRTPECVKDFFRAVDDLRQDAKMGAKITPERCQSIVCALEKGLLCLQVTNNLPFKGNEPL
jgi:hypothetical protein